MIYEIRAAHTLLINGCKPLSLHPGEFFEAERCGPRYCFSTYAVIGGQVEETGVESAWLEPRQYCDMVAQLVREGVISYALPR